MYKYSVHGLINVPRISDYFYLINRVIDIISAAAAVTSYSKLYYDDIADVNNYSVASDHTCPREINCTAAYTVYLCNRLPLARKDDVRIKLCKVNYTDFNIIHCIAIKLRREDTMDF